MASIPGLSGNIPSQFVSGGKLNTTNSNAISIPTLQALVNNGGLRLDNVPASQPTGYEPTPSGGGGTDYGSGGSGATYVTAPSAPAPPPNYWLPNDEAAYQQGVAVANNGLARIPTQLDIANANIGDQFNQKNNGLNNTRDVAQTSYNQDTTRNGQQFVTNKNTIADEASQGLSSLMRLLGLHGAGGSSTAMYSAPEAVATHASQERSGAGQTFAQNQQGLDTNWGQFQNDFQGKQHELQDWRTQQEQQARITADTNKQALLQQLAGLNGNKAAAQGGSAAAAEQPFINQIQAASGEIDNLGRFSPTWSGSNPIYTPKALDAYNIQPVAGPQAQGGGILGDTTTPFLSLLLGQKKDQQPFLSPAQ